MEPDELMAMTIIFGEFDGREYDWSEGRWKPLRT